jgi:FlaA1/EpsC-like NDP-sugar epimerase
MGGPVTVTHPDVTRYFMTVHEAVALVLQAGANAPNGGILILDMEEPVRIRDIADRLIRLAGYEPDRDIRVVYTGLRPGEKLTEELYDDKQETLEPTECEKIFRIRKEIALPRDFMQRLESLRVAVSEEQDDYEEYLRALVTTYHEGEDA